MSEHKFLLRVPVAMWDELRLSAGRNRRSINSEILWRLGAERAPMVEFVMDSPGVPYQAPADPSVIRAPGNRVSFRPDFKGGKK